VRGKVQIVYNRFGEMPAAMRERADYLTGHTAYNILAHAKNLMAAGPHTGRIYQRGNITHQASAPGEPPAVDTGTLTNSGGAERLAQNLWAVFFSARHAALLEYGTPTIEARPFLRPAVERFRQAYYDGLAALLRQV